MRYPSRVFASRSRKKVNGLFVELSIDVATGVIVSHHWMKDESHPETNNEALRVKAVV